MIDELAFSFTSRGQRSFYVIAHFKVSAKGDSRIQQNGGPQIGLSAVIESPRSHQGTYRIHILTIASLLTDLHVIFGIFKIGCH